MSHVPWSSAFGFSAVAVGGGWLPLGCPVAGAGGAVDSFGGLAGVWRPLGRLARLWGLLRAASPIDLDRCG
jgi:hypothetical protein